MPHKDPRTGVSVMTTHEFFQAEAKREGKGRTGLDLMSDFADQFEQDRLEREKELKQPKAAFEMLRDAVRELNSYETDAMLHMPEPEEVIEVIAAECRDTIRQNAHMIKARCKRSGGVEDVLTMEATYSHGNREEPPDGEILLKWKKISAEIGP